MGGPFVFVQVSQDAVDNVLVLDATVRRLDNYPAGTSATATDLDTPQGTFS